MNELIKNQELLLSIKRIGINGEGIGYYKKLAVFVKNALPGEECVVKITKVYDKYSEAELVRIKKNPSKDRIMPACPYYEKCGGCQLQHINYEAGLKYKKDIVMESFKRYFNSELNPKIFKDTIGMEQPYGYRNKAKHPVRYDGEKLVTGLYGDKSNILIYIDECIIEKEDIRETLKNICHVLTKNEIIAYHPKSKEGVLRHIVVRSSSFTGKIQVTLILYKKDKRTIDIAKKLIGIHGVDSIYVSINSNPDSLENFGEEIFKVSGSDTITEKLGKYEFELLPNSFFQLNLKQTEVLYDNIVKYAKFDGTERVLDAYSGVGTIGLWISEYVKEVRGIDNNDAAIINANANVKRNNVLNATYYSGDILKLLEKFKKEGWVPDVLVVDPPRMGIDIRLLNYLQKNPVKKIIYVSCNPATLAKNCDHLSREYHILAVQCLDMFPQTADVECVTVLVNKHLNK